MTARCKFLCVSKTQTAFNQVIKLEARYDESIPEDQRFCKATPSGTFEMSTTRPEIADKFIPGQSYYLDIPLPD